jgi:hypothetical protein
MAQFYVSVSGNIGVGKSTLSEKISRFSGYYNYPEPVSNPYLKDFYTDMGKWGFHSQVSFILNYTRTHQEITLNRMKACQDRNLYELNVFAQSLFGYGVITLKDKETLQSLIKTCLFGNQIPNLLIYLKASVPTLLRRIQKRGDKIEETIDDIYLQTLNATYEKWITSLNICPVVVVDTEIYDLLHNEVHFQKLINIVDLVYRRSEHIQPVIVL